MKHNYFHYAYLTQTENYSERGRTGGVYVYKNIYTVLYICTVHETEGHERHEVGRKGERGGSAKKVGG